MNNKGFIATSLVYSFFLVLMVMIIAILSNYVTTKTIQKRYNDVIKEDINSIEVKLHLYVMGGIESESFKRNPDITVKEKQTYLNGASALELDSFFKANTDFSYSVVNLRTNETFELSVSGVLSNPAVKCIPEVTVNKQSGTITFSNVRKETLCYIY